MEGHAFANADGDFLIVPQQGSELLTIIAFLFLC
jgi:homogentisate 1,2-dioxygenase